MVFVMQRKLFTLLLIFLLLLASVGCSTNNTSNSNDDNPSTATETPSTETSTKAQYSWVVEPKFDYPSIAYDWVDNCYMANVNASSEDRNTLYKIISSETGEIIGDPSPHGFVDLLYSYDPNKKKYGSYDGFSMEVFDDLDTLLTSNFKSAFFPIMQMEIFVDGKYLANDTEEFVLMNKYALANRQGPITGFIFDDSDKVNTNTLAMKQNGKWGFVDASGKFIIEPVFEDAISIDDQRAFAKLDGKWGIIAKKSQ